jgi:hypothetical protein
MDPGDWNMFPVNGESLPWPDIFIGLGTGFFSDNSLFIHPSKTMEKILHTDSQPLLNRDWREVLS